MEKELWDILDKNGNKTGRVHVRGEPMDPDDFHLIVHVWKYNSEGKWLIDKRAPRYGRPDLDGKWETTGGAAISGDDSLTAALREAKEELGLDLDPENGSLFRRVFVHGKKFSEKKGSQSWLVDVWVFKHDCETEDLTLQEDETTEAKWVTVEQIKELMESGEFLGNYFYPYFDEMINEYT